MQPVISIILPIHNQADHLIAVVGAYHAALATLGAPFEIILVENGSLDDSAARCAELASRHDEIRTIHSDPGWGRAVRSGLAAARGELLCFTNSARTASTDLRAIVEAGLKVPAGILKAERNLRDSWVRTFASWLYNVEVRLLFGLKLRDVNGTPKLFNRRYGALLNLRRDDDLIDLEFCLTCQRHSYPMNAFAVGATNRHGGRSTTGWRTALRLYLSALRIRFNNEL